MINIKKLSFLLISILVISMVACEAKENIYSVKNLTVSISTDVDTYDLYMSSIRGITLTPHLVGTTDKDIQYHWSIDSNTELFSLPNGTQKEIVNSGESVLFVAGAEKGYIEAGKLSDTIKVNLKIEEKQSSDILAETELIIEDYSGTYKVKK